MCTQRLCVRMRYVVVHVMGFKVGSRIDMSVCVCRKVSCDVEWIALGFKQIPSFILRTKQYLYMSCGAPAERVQFQQPHNDWVC